MPQGIPNARTRFLECSDAPLLPADHAAAAGFLHFCDEWDGLLIDRSDLEFDFCGCSFRYPDFDPFTGRQAPVALPEMRA